MILAFSFNAYYFFGLQLLFELFKFSFFIEVLFNINNCIFFLILFLIILYFLLFFCRLLRVNLMSCNSGRSRWTVLYFRWPVKGPRSDRLVSSSTRAEFGLVVERRSRKSAPVVRDLFLAPSCVVRM